MKADDAYARLTAYFPEGEVIYSNPFARYDSSVSESPYMGPSHTVNIPLTIIFNIIVLALCAGVIYILLIIIYCRPQKLSCRTCRDI